MLSDDAPLDFIETPRVVIAKALEWLESHEQDWHFHNCGQLLYASDGIMNVTTVAGTYVVPPQRAVWLPKDAHHKVRANTRLAVRTLYIDETAAPWLSASCFVMSVSPLLRELILEAMELPSRYPIGGREERIMALIVDELSVATGAQLNLHLPIPRDKRVVPIVRAIESDPAIKRSAADWSRHVGASGRTIDRIFQSETGMSFDQWRRQALLLEALRHLADGKPVTNVALDLGYESPSAFIAMFRRVLGTTPGKLFS